MSAMKQLQWYGLYNESWQGEITPEAFSHPAKFSRGLIRQIYKYMMDEGMLAAGDHVVDPFGGVGLGALDAMRHGLHWHGCELEPRFHELGNQNIGLWNGRYRGWFDLWGTAVLHCGDSRQLAQVIGAADGCVSSPPFLENAHPKQELKGKQLEVRTNQRHEGEKLYFTEYYVPDSPGQLGSMKAGDYDAAVSSPPFENSLDNIISRAHDGKDNGAVATFKRTGQWPERRREGLDYGTTPGQLGSMKAGDYDAAVSSPPFEAGLGHGKKETERKDYFNAVAGASGTDYSDYGTTPNNIGNDTGESFWLAARDIVAQVYAVLKPGGVAAWVCGDFVRRGERVYFGRQWLALCESVGFEPVAWAVAWKTEYNGNQLDIFGGDVEKRTDRVSFFRRLANEKNPDAAILNEDVIFVRKPA